MGGVSTKVKKKISVLPNDFANLVNLPQINGVELKGNLNAKQLKLMPQNVSDYEKVTLSIIDTKSNYLMVFTETDGEPVKLPIEEILAVNKGIDTTNEITPDMPVGTFRFVII